MDITGFTLLAEQFVPDPLLGLGIAIISGIVLWILMLAFVQFILFIISCFKHTIPFSDTLSKAFRAYKANYKSFFKYYLVVIGIWAITTVLNVLGTISLFGEANLLTLLIVMPLIPLSILHSIYYVFLDSSIAKSYYKKKFEFSWISGMQFLKLFAVGIIFATLAMFSIFLLGIPWIFLAYLLPFVRYPIIIEDADIFDSVKRAYGMLKKEFWNIVFFVGVYGLIFGVVYFTLSFTLGLIPGVVSVFNEQLGQVLSTISSSFINIITLVIVQPFGTFLLTDIYKKIEGKYLSVEPGAEINKYVADMKDQGFSDKQIKDALKSSGHTNVGKYF